MTKYVEWDEPYDTEATANLICRLTYDDVVKVQTEHAWQVAKHIYANEQDAVDDFMTVHWGRIVES